MLNDLLKRIADTGRQLTGGAENRSRDLIDLCDALLRGKGEATGIATAADILDGYRKLGENDRAAFFQNVMRRFSADEARVRAAIERFDSNPQAAARDLHFASEPPSQELLRRLNRAPGGTDGLISMRRDLLDAAVRHPELRELDRDFSHLLGSWFNRGFLELRRIDWKTPAEVLERIIEYEAVHEITSWDDLRGRVATPDRRLYGFFHPAMPGEPLIFVEVALTKGLPSSIGSILSPRRERLDDPESARTAVFYSISNCHAGLRGISFGNFLIKQVVEDLRHELPSLRTFVTLSPAPGLRRWARQQVGAAESTLSQEQKQLVRALESGSADLKNPDNAKPLAEIAARYLVQPSERGGVIDPVARFHLGNGARLERINPGADPSARGMKNAWGVMVNYLYALSDIERNHETYASSGEVVCSSGVRRLAKA